MTHSTNYEVDYGWVPLPDYVMRVHWIDLEEVRKLLSHKLPEWLDDCEMKYKDGFFI